MPRPRPPALRQAAESTIYACRIKLCGHLRHRHARRAQSADCAAGVELDPSVREEGAGKPLCGGCSRFIFGRKWMLCIVHSQVRCSRSVWLHIGRPIRHVFYHNGKRLSTQRSNPVRPVVVCIWDRVSRRPVPLQRPRRAATAQHTPAPVVVPRVLRRTHQSHERVDEAARERDFAAKAAGRADGG
jgi:hypothetical protein